MKVNRFGVIMLLALNISVMPSYAGTPSPAAQAPYNIILVINDQERYQLDPVIKNQLPARAALRQHGVTFTNHYIATAMCSPSRASFLTGTAPQVNGVYDQMVYKFVPSLNPAIPNMGSILKKLGYHTAYFGKFEMDKTLLQHDKNVNYSSMAQSYGFDVFNADGDVSGKQWQGYQDDTYFVGEALRWLRENAPSKLNHAKPFFMVVSLVNPHDIMYGDANLPGTPVAQRPAVQDILPPPASALYAKNWRVTLPSSLTDSLTAPGMPSALMEYQLGWGAALGSIPVDRKDMWQYYNNYYLNTIRDNDRNLQLLVNAMSELDLWKNTVIVFTADHGEMAGAHGGIRGKGPFAYEENIHVPLIIDHPDAPKGAVFSPLTSHLDLLPTLVGLTGLPEATRDALTEGLPGVDFSELVTQPEKPDLNEIRPGILFNYVGISTIDSRFLLNNLRATFKHSQAFPALSDIRLSNRGFVTVVYDGRYKMARYYSPDDFNTPTTLENLLAHNDVQLFDLQRDPAERNNLALDLQQYKEVLSKMNALMNELIAREVGINDGAFLPAVIRPGRDS